MRLKSLSVLIPSLVSVFCCLVSLAASEKFYPLKSKWTIAPTEIMTELSKPLKPIEQVGKFPKSVGLQVAEMLTQVRFKKRPNVILNKFSVSDLLELNKVSLDHCHVDELSKRESFCERLKDHENLLKYCEKAYSNLVDWCSFKIDFILEATLLKLSIMSKVQRLLKKVRKHVKETIKQTSEGEGEIKSGEVIKTILAERNVPYKEEAKSVCQSLTNEIDTNYRLKLSSQPIDLEMKTWQDFFKYCRMLLLDTTDPTPSNDEA